MKTVTDNIFCFLLISCFIHALALWVLGVKTPLAESPKLPGLHFIFEDTVPDIASHPVPPTPERYVKLVRQREPKRYLPGEHPLEPGQKSLEAEPAPSSLIEDESEPKTVEEEASLPLPASLDTPVKEEALPVSTSRLEVSDPPVSKQNILEGYLARIRTLLEQNKNYPLWARRNNWQGMVRLYFIISRNGSVEEVRVIDSSGFNVLDEAARLAIERVGRFPSIPKELAMNRLSLDVPLVFRLVDR